MENKRRPIGNCYYCGKVILLAPGQLIRKYKRGEETIYFHKKCRRKAKKIGVIKE